jgi:hypothetical protein
LSGFLRRNRGDGIAAWPKTLLSVIWRPRTQPWPQILGTVYSRPYKPSLAAPSDPPRSLGQGGIASRCSVLADLKAQRSWFAPRAFLAGRPRQSTKDGRDSRQSRGALFSQCPRSTLDKQVCHDVRDRNPLGSVSPDELVSDRERSVRISTPPRSGIPPAAVASVAEPRWLSPARLGHQ